MSKKRFIKDCLEKLEDVNSFQIKGGTVSTGDFELKDLTDNLLPILKDLIEDNIDLKNEIKKLKEEIELDISKIKIGGTD